MSITKWLQKSIKNKIMMSVLSVFILVYGATLGYIYLQSKNDIIKSARQEALSTVQILAVTIYRNYDTQNDFREIQSYIKGAKIYKNNLLEINIINKDLELICSTSEEKLFKVVTGKIFKQALNNRSSISLHLEREIPAIQIVYPISAGMKRKNITQGAIDVTFSLSQQMEQLADTGRNFLLSALIIIITIIIAINFISKSITKPIYNLYSGMSEVNKGSLDISVEQISQDEVGFLTNTFNTMVASIKKSNNELKSYAADLKNANAKLMYLNISATRFVPTQFLQILGKEDIVSIKLGDAVLKNMTVLFLDIRNFTSMSEALSAKENLEFLNSLLQRLSPAIEKNNGFIDKFIGDAIMALFNGDVDDALRAALDMRDQLKAYNKERRLSKESEIEFGIGINSGELILGTVGSQNRIDTTVIGNTVNLASRLETLTKNYNLPVIFSEFVFRRIVNPDSFPIKKLERAKIKGMEKAVDIYGLDC